VMGPSGSGKARRPPERPARAAVRVAARGL